MSKYLHTIFFSTKMWNNTKVLLYAGIEVGKCYFVCSRICNVVSLVYWVNLYFVAMGY